MKKEKNFNNVDEVYVINGEGNTARNAKKTILFEDEESQCILIEEDDASSESEEKVETVFINLEDEEESTDDNDNISNDEVRIIGKKNKKKKDFDKQVTTIMMSFMAIITLILVIGLSCTFATEGPSYVWNSFIQTKTFLCNEFGQTLTVGLLLVVLFALHLMGNSIYWMYRSLLKINEVGFKNAIEDIHTYAQECANEINKNAFKALKLVFATGIVYFVWNFLSEV